jgi:hypothetical protein
VANTTIRNATTSRTARRIRIGCTGAPQRGS